MSATLEGPRTGTAADVAVAVAGPPPSRDRRSPRLGLLIASAYLVLVALAAVHPALFTSVSPNAADPVAALTPPGGEHWLGTDQSGRDVFARIVNGTGLSLTIGLGASVIALAAGIVVGVLAAQGGRLLDAVVDRLLDVSLALPGVLLVLLLVAIAGPGTPSLIAGLAVVLTPGYARLVRGEVIRIRRAAFVEAALALGWSRPQVVLRHVVPNALGPVLVLGTIGVGQAIGIGSSLSFLGLGPQPPAAEWGAMLASARDYFAVAWWTAVFPGVAISLTVLAVTVAGRSLRLRAEGRSA